VEDNADLVWGAANIGRLIGKSQRATFYLLERGALPASKVREQWVAERSKLLDLARWPCNKGKAG
jgi:hypothetical protein